MRRAQAAVALAMTVVAGAATAQHVPAAARSPRLADVAEVPDAPDAPDAAARLGCFARHYVGVSTTTASGAPALRLPDGTLLLWDDGRPKTAAEALVDPDLQDTLEQPYEAGPIRPVDEPDRDPGRRRVEALFAATYGATAAAVQARLVDVDFVGQPVRIHERAAAALTRVDARLRAAIPREPGVAAFVTGPLGGTFAWRAIAKTHRRSAHAWGIAIDIAVARSDYWEWAKGAADVARWTNRVPQAVVDAFEAEGFVWGGRWQHFDTMHFEHRPELFDPACRGP